MGTAIVTKFRTTIRTTDVPMVVRQTSGHPSGQPSGQQRAGKRDPPVAQVPARPQPSHRPLCFPPLSSFLAIYMCIFIFTHYIHICIHIHIRTHIYMYVCIHMGDHRPGAPGRSLFCTFRPPPAASPEASRAPRPPTMVSRRP